MIYTIYLNILTSVKSTLSTFADQPCLFLPTTLVRFCRLPLYAFADYPCTLLPTTLVRFCRLPLYMSVRLAA